MTREELNNFYKSAISYLSGGMPEVDSNIFIEELDHNPQLKGLFFQIKDVWEYHDLQNKAESVNLNEVWNDLIVDGLLEDKEANSWGKVISFVKRWHVAAAIAILIGISSIFTVFDFPISNSSNLAHIIECSKGDMVKMKLSDGSAVWLNSDSKLSLHENFSSLNREISLVGEAFFDVATDSLNPFVINIADCQVCVKGTSFNLRHYPEENSFQTSLEEGVIEVKKGLDVFRLRPGEQFNIDMLTGKSTISKSKNLHYISSWRTGRLEFDSLPLKELVNYIERWYSYSVVIEDAALLNQKFSGVLKHNKTIDHIMHLLMVNQNISYKIEGDTVYIKRVTTGERLN